MNAEVGNQRESEPDNSADSIESIASEALASKASSKNDTGTHHIARLLDAGTIEDGRHFLVKEYVDGQPIDTYCDSQRLDIHQRLKLITRVCEAVHFAHQHAVIHGDLKPNNILVTADGVPKLINFGAAKLINSEAGVDDTEGTGVRTILTPIDELVLNPEYSSPEQVKGELVTTASDVYSLGVVLYKLLTGRSPYRLKVWTTSEICRAICEQVPERPSVAVSSRAMQWTTKQPATQAIPEPEMAAATAENPSVADLKQIAAARDVAPSRLKQILRSDLDSIVLFALRKEPERRYASAGQFAGDLNRYLKGLSVRAHHGSILYRTTKFARQHALVVSACVLFFLALMAGVVGTTMGLIATRRERDRVAKSARQAREVIDQFFTRVSEERLLNQPGLNPLRKSLLEDAQRFYEEFVAQSRSDPALRAELAAAYMRMASMNVETGQPDQAVAQFEQSIGIWESLLARRPDELIYQEKLARVFCDLGLAHMRLTGRQDEALHAFSRAQGLLVSLVARDPAAIAGRHELGLVLRNIAEILFEQDQSEDAIEKINQVFEIESELLAENPRDLDSQIALAQAYGLMGQIQLLQPDGLELAIKSQQKAVELEEKVTHGRPDLADQSFQLAMSVSNLSGYEQMAGKLDSALLSEQKVIEILERLDRQFPAVAKYRGGLAAAYNLLSDLHRQRREPAESLHCAQKAKTILEPLVAEHLDDVVSRTDLAKSHNYIGRSLQGMGDFVEALQSFKRAVDLYESIPELDPSNGYNLACNLALCIPLIGAKTGLVKPIDVTKLSKIDQLRRQRYGNRAIEVLREAIKGGFLNLDFLRSDSDLDSIRDRPDFQVLIDEVEKKAADDEK